MREMLAAGFSASLARYLTEKLPEQGGDAMGWIKSVLVRNLSERMAMPRLVAQTRMDKPLSVRSSTPPPIGERPATNG